MQNTHKKVLTQKIKQKHKRKKCTDKDKTTDTKEKIHQQKKMQSQQIKFKD